MAENKLSAISMSRACGFCHLTIAPFASQVIDGSRLYHRECHEAWYFRRHGRRPYVQRGHWPVGTTGSNGADGTGGTAPASRGVRF
jgi:hypothetical protein